MSISQNYDGAIVIAAIVQGYRIQRVYYGYTKREAVKLFKMETK